ncbi:MAG: tetratricopeptide repeat protein [Desulfuromonadales bacterium]
MPVSRSIITSLAVPLLTVATFILSGCAESVRKVHPLITETPAYSKALSGEESNLSQKNPDELIAAGFGYLAVGNASLARLHFVAALKRDPQSAWAYVGLGDADYRSGDYPSALTNFQKAGMLDPQNLSAILGQAQALRQQGKAHAAGEQLSQALKMAPDDVRVLTELAITYDIQGQENLAAPLYREIAAKAPDQAASYNNIGVSELSQGRYAVAIVNFSKAFMLDEKNERITNNLAMAFALYGQEDQAVKLFSRTVGEAAAWNNLGYLYMTRERFDDAERALRKALELNPKHYPKAQENLERLEHLRKQG